MLSSAHSVPINAEPLPAPIVPIAPTAGPSISGSGSIGDRLTPPALSAWPDPAASGAHGFSNADFDVYDRNRDVLLHACPSAFAKINAGAVLSTLMARVARTYTVPRRGGLDLAPHTRFWYEEVMALIDGAHVPEAAQHAPDKLLDLLIAYDCDMMQNRPS
jgi:hypothetical protein